MLKILLLLDTKDDLGDKTLPRLLSMDETESALSRDTLWILLEGDSNTLLLLL